MRVTYLDESGTGNIRLEPIVVVAAISIHPDSQWKQIADYLADMTAEYVPAEKREAFKGFHAYELFSGSSVFERKPGEFGRWWPVLDELLSIPKKFDLPVGFGHMPRGIYEPGGDGHNSALAAGITPVIAAQMAAFSIAAYSVNHWMKAACPDELSLMIMENNQHSQKFIKATQRLLADKNQSKLLEAKGGSLRDIDRLMWPMHFEDKGESSALQVVDACAWALRRRLSGEPNSDRFYDLIEPQLINRLAELPLVKQWKPKGQASP